MKTTTAIKISTATLIFLIVGFILSMITIKNYAFDWSFGTALCSNVCILCWLIEKKKKEDKADNTDSKNIDNR